MLVLLITGSIINTAGAQQTKSVKLTVKYKADNIEKGYDHLSRLVLYINGQKLATSLSKPESKSNKLAISLTTGTYVVKAVMESLYHKKWEEHTKANGYNIDCVAERKITLIKNTSLQLIFDFNKGTILKKEE